MKALRTLWLVALPALAAAITACGGGQLPDDMALEVSPLTVTFASVNLGDDVTHTVTLKHVGTTGTIVTSFKLSDATNPDFSFVDPAKKSLAPGESTQVVVHYNPKVTVGGSGELVITHNVPPAYETRVSLKAAAGYGDLIADPDPIDFGNVSVVNEKTKTLDVVLKNMGTKPVTITDLRLRDATGDFAFADGSLGTSTGPAFPVTLAPNSGDEATAAASETTLQLSYTPKGGGCDNTELWVMRQDQAVPTAFQVTGCELGPKIVITPGQVDFGFVKPAETKTVAVTIANEGNDDLVVMDLSVVNGTDPELKVDPTPATSTPAGPWTIKAGESRSDVNVSWKAMTAHDPTLPFDNLRVLCNDSNSNAVLIPVFGTLDAPDIALLPPDVVDFGIVAQLISTQRTLTLLNNGHGDLVVSKIEIDKSKDTLDEFSMIADAAFPPSTGAGPATIAGFGTGAVTLQFINKGPASGDVIVPLTVTTNSPGKETLSVNLKASRSGKATCSPVLIPGTVNFGNIALGNSKTLNVNVHNKGTGNCSFAQARIDDCPAGMFGGATCSAPFAGSISKAFTIVSAPSATPNGIGPGMDGVITVKYEPPKVSTMFGVLNSFYGLLSVKVLDSNVGVGVTPPEIILPAGTAPKPNLTGQAGVPQVSVLPGQVKFGLVTIGCYSKTYQVCVYSTGNAPLTVSDISLKGCTPEFKVKDVPGLPKDVNAGTKMCFGVAFAPQDTTAEGCNVAITTNDQSTPTLNVMLSGEGTYDSEQTDSFIQASGQSVDVLFVIDDSGSMCSSQDTLIKNYPTFLSHANLGNDYHIGVVSVNVTAEMVAGKLNRGDPALSPRFVTPGANAVSQFSTLANLDCNGCPAYANCSSDMASDTQESGLEAAQLALTAPLSIDTMKACTKDSDCTSDPNLCGDPKTCPYSCWQGTCGGWNKDFLRDDAQLEIVVLSDEDDQSPSGLPFYIDFFKNIKGFYNVGMMHLHAIVWQDSGCPTPPSSQGTGDRYIKAAQETNGQIGNICDSDYGPIMDKIGISAFQPKVQFFLTRLADPPTVTVKVDDAACATGWKYDSNSNSVVFDVNGTCMPQPGQKIDIHYKTLCLTS